MKTFQSEDDRWTAVLTRDPAADGHFFYAVASTGIYCYPSCPSRLAKRDNVSFYIHSKQAKADGYMACKRCRSDLPPLLDRQRALVINACRLLSDKWSEKRVDAVAESLNVSRFHLQKLFRKFLGLSPKAYAQAARTQQLNEVVNNASNITQALYDAGYESPSTFYKDVALRLGMSVKQLREGAPCIEIYFGFATTRYGKILVATTPKGVCAVLFGSSQKMLEADLNKRFPKASCISKSETADELITRVVQQIEQPEMDSQIPLDIKGTVFQEKVWMMLRSTRCGETMSYAELAKAVGKPKAARAVAGACAANPLAVLVPCHRVLRGDGSLSGYRWGVDRKARLLADESSVKPRQIKSGKRIS